MSVAVNRTFGFAEKAESADGQRQKSRLFDLSEDLADLLTCGSVDASVGDIGFPVQQMAVLLGQAGKLPALQGVRLDILYTTLGLTLVAGSIRFGRQDDRAVMIRKGSQAGIQFRIVPVGFTYRSF